MAIHFITLLCVLSHSGFGGGRVAMSLYALDLGASALTIGTLTALYAVFPLLLAVRVGRLADRIGPRVPMLIGTAGVAIGLLLPPLFPGMMALYLSALVLGSTFHFFFITVQGIAGGVGGAEHRARNFALVGMGFSAAGFLGPYLAGLAIDHLGHLRAFFVLAALAAIPTLLMLMRPGLLPAARGHAVAHGPRNARDLWAVPDLRKTFIASGIISSGWDLFQFYFPIYGHALGLSASAIGAVLGVFALATFTIRLLLPPFTRRFSEAQILSAGIFCAAGAFVLLPLFSDVYMLAGVAFLLGLGVGCGQPMSMSLIYALAPTGRAAECAGLRVTVNNFVHLVIPLLFGSIGTAFGYGPVFLSNGALLAAGAILVRRARIGSPPPDGHRPPAP